MNRGKKKKKAFKLERPRRQRCVCVVCQIINNSPLTPSVLNKMLTLDLVTGLNLFLLPELL